MGPPPATRPTRPSTQSADAGFDGDEGPTIVRKPARSGLPPRPRRPDARPDGKPDGKPE